jgi:hypothetical protein
VRRAIFRKLLGLGAPTLEIQPIGAAMQQMRYCNSAVHRPCANVVDNPKGAWESQLK